MAPRATSLLLVLAVAPIAFADSAPPSSAAWQTRCAARFERARAELVARDDTFASARVTVEPFPESGEGPTSGAPSVHFMQYISHGDQFVAVVWAREHKGKTTAWHRSHLSSRQLHIVRDGGRLSAALSIGWGRDFTEKQAGWFRAAFQPAIDDCLK